MADTVTTGPGVVSTRVLVPLKSFSRAKARLSAVLSEEQRVQLARCTAEIVLAAARPMPVHVVCDDREVARWAEAHHADVVWSPGTGLDAAVRGGVARLAEAGADLVVVAHGDLPCATLLGRPWTAGAVTLVPDRVGDGTNVAVVPAAADFPFAYGRRSFERHQRLAIEARLPLVVCRDPQLAIDIDTPDDLAHPLVQEALPEWLRTTLPTIPASPAPAARR